MLMGFAEVTKDGKFSKKGDLRVLYTVMMYVRMLLCKDAMATTWPATLFGIRYGVIRRQFSTEVGNEERKIMDYQTHQHTFGVLISKAIVLAIVGYYMRD